VGSALVRLGRHEEAEASLRRAIELDPESATIRYNLGNGLVAGGRFEEAVEAYREAIRLDHDYPEAHCNLGHALLARGQFGEAAESMRRGHELGSRRRDWSYPSAEWVGMSERLAALESRLPAILAGEDRPADDEEILGFADICRRKGRHVAAARFYDEAFAANPMLARRLTHRYEAAYAAALAGTGSSLDAEELDDKERGRWRTQALRWLRASLGLDGKEAPTLLARRLRPHAVRDPDLAGVRDEAELAKLPEAEQAEWRAFWAEVRKALAGAKGE
jgi:tetratricopeptide (TPR) repeat protein